MRKAEFEARHAYVLFLEGEDYRAIGRRYGAKTVIGQIARGKRLVALGASLLAGQPDHPLSPLAAEYTPVSYELTERDETHMRLDKARIARKRLVTRLMAVI